MKKKQLINEHEVFGAWSVWLFLCKQASLWVKPDGGAMRNSAVAAAEWRCTRVVLGFCQTRQMQCKLWMYFAWRYENVEMLLKQVRESGSLKLRSALSLRSSPLGKDTLPAGPRERMFCRWSKEPFGAFADKRKNVVWVNNGLQVNGCWSLWKQSKNPSFYSSFQKPRKHWN